MQGLVVRPWAPRPKTVQRVRCRVQAPASRVLPAPTASTSDSESWGQTGFPEGPPESPSQPQPPGLQGEPPADCSSALVGPRQWGPHESSCPSGTGELYGKYTGAPQPVPTPTAAPTPSVTWSTVAQGRSPQQRWGGPAPGWGESPELEGRGFCVPAPPLHPPWLARGHGISFRRLRFLTKEPCPQNGHMTGHIPPHGASPVSQLPTRWHFWPHGVPAPARPRPPRALECHGAQRRSAAVTTALPQGVTRGGRGTAAAKLAGQGPLSHPRPGRRLAPAHDPTRRSSTPL